MIWSLKLELKMTPGNTQTKGKTVNSSSAKVSSTQNDSLYKSLMISGCWLVENHTIWGWVVGCDWCMSIDCWLPTGSGPRNVDTHIVTLCCGWPRPATAANQYSSPELESWLVINHSSEDFPPSLWQEPGIDSGLGRLPRTHLLQYRWG